MSPNQRDSSTLTTLPMCAASTRASMGSSRHPESGMRPLTLFSRRKDSVRSTLTLSSSGKVIIFLYVDDLLIAASPSLLDSIKQMLHQQFRMKDLGEATSLLNIEIIRNRQQQTIMLRQLGYLRSILATYNMSNYKAISTSIEVKTSLPKLPATPTSALSIPYRQEK